MLLIQPWVVIFIVFTCGNLGQAKNCVTDSPCKCTYDDGSGSVDISSIGKQDGTPWFKDVVGADAMKYSYNPCFSFEESACTNAAVCQWNGQSTYTTIGVQSGAVFSYDTTLNTLRIEYTTSGTGIQQKSIIYLNCQESAKVPELYPSGSTGFYQYSFQLFSECACAGKCKGAEVAASITISVGTILCIVVSKSVVLSYICADRHYITNGAKGIIPNVYLQSQKTITGVYYSGLRLRLHRFLCAVVIYFTGGVLYYRYAKHRSGLEMVPHVEFWRGVPGAAKDGCMFLVGKVTGRGGYSKI